MRLIATMPVRNEAWILGLSARVALMWCDELCIANHASTDATADILADLMTEFPGRVHLVSMPDTVWTEMQHRQYLLEMARLSEATHIAIIDADEILCGNVLDGRGFREYVSLGCHTTARNVLQLPLYNMRGAIDRFHTNGVWGKRWGSVAFKDDPRLYWSKEYDRGGYDHHAREPKGMLLTSYRPVAQGDGGIMHLWGSSEKRLHAKHRLYRITERIRWPEKPVDQIESMYSLAERGRPPHDMPEGWEFQKAPASWWKPYEHLMKYLDLDAEPWHNAEAERLIEKHGKEFFKGLSID